MNYDEKLDGWAEDVESGRTEDPLLKLAAQLREEDALQATPAPLEFRRQLRRDLLNQYESEPSLGWAQRIWRPLGTAVALAALALVVVYGWFMIGVSGRPIAGGQPENAVANPSAQVSKPVTAPEVEVTLPALAGYEMRTGDANTNPDDRGEAIVRPDSGADLDVVLHWELPDGPSGISVFVHLVGPTGELVAQTDAALDSITDPETGAASLPFTLPEAVDPTGYSLVTGLYDSATQERLSVQGQEEPTTELSLGSGPWEAIADSVIVRDVTPSSGTVLTGTDPLPFEIVVDYQLVTAPEALLDVRLTTPVGEDAGRGVATVQAPIFRGNGQLTLPLELLPQHEINGAADLGLWVQIKTEERKPPLFMDFPETYQWRIEP